MLRAIIAEGPARADGSFEYECGAGSGLFTYPTEENAGKSPATLAAWQVDDIEATATQLGDKDVVLEEYDMPGLETEDGIRHASGRQGTLVQGPGWEHPQRLRARLNGDDDRHVARRAWPTRASP